MKFNLQHYPLVVFDSHIHTDNHAGQVSRDLVAALKAANLSVIITDSIEDCLENLIYTTNISCVILDWDSFQKNNQLLQQSLVKIDALNELLPIFIMTQSHELDDTSASIFNNDINFFWKYADTSDFIVGRIKKAVEKYLDALLPTFFKALMHYTEQYKYTWATPGHMGGAAFLKSPIGRMLYDFYGPNVFLSDLSISTPELGSLMDHSGVEGAAETYAATIFGADHTFFVTNGTSTSNKMVLMSCTGKNEVALIDRNCHKSLQHAMTMADVIPIYLKPTRNAYGIIGTIPLHEFSPESIIQKIKDCPLIQDKSIVPALVTITNSTYDGLIYQVEPIKEQLSKSNIPHLHFDEAWYPYAHFHPIYQGKYAMSPDHKDYHPTLFSTQSTHKLLAAFSQASMLHIKNGIQPLNVPLFNETFMMHTSTSPQYSIIASLNVASKMMEGKFGYRLISESIANAIAFRQEFHKIKQHLHATKKTWFFDLWQPDSVLSIPKASTHHFIDLPLENAEKWMLKSGEQWHGFGEIDDHYTMLDPIKVTVLTPGLNHDTSFEKTGIPAPIVSRYLMNAGVVDEKTSFYSMLFLFSIGVNKSKSMNLLSDLMLFKDAYDKNLPLTEVFPTLLAEHPNTYRDLGLQDLCQKMHLFLKHANASNLLMHAYETLPVQAMTPNAAYQYIVKATCTAFPLDELENKTVVTMIAPYPPGIPLIMPGEKITPDCRIMIDYLKMLEHFDNTFPGFENDIHGVVVKIVHGKRKYYLNGVS